MPFRKALFWVHLAVGVSVGSVVLMMAVTGTLLTYQKQMTEWADHAYWVAPSVEGQRAPASEVFAAAQAYDPASRVQRLIVYSDADAPVAAYLDGGTILYLDPSTAEVRGEGTTEMRAFFSVVVRMHRWFNLSGENRTRARAITGWSNLAFLFLILSGIFLWVPRRFKWQHIRAVTVLNPKARGKARDFNWHNVFGLWMSFPLALIVASATVISFPWASNLAYRVMGETPPQRNASASSSLVTDPVEQTPPAPFEAAMLNGPFEAAMTGSDDWRTITAYVPDDADTPFDVRVEAGWAGEPQKRHTLTFDPSTGRELASVGFADQSPGRRLRTYLRFLHTGEYYGMWGQTLAGLASLGAVLLSWSGLALAWRRLVVPVIRRARNEATRVGASRSGDMGSQRRPQADLRLVDVTLGERVALVRIDLPQGQMEPLLERGMLPGCDLCPIRRSPFGDAIIEVDGSVLAVRHEVASCLCVRRLDDR